MIILRYKAMFLWQSFWQMPGLGTKINYHDTADLLFSYQCCSMSAENLLT